MGTLFEVWRERAEKIGRSEESLFFDTRLCGFWESEDDVPVSGIEETRAE